ncbi:MAG: hypothetical protein ASARMPRED_004019 [Alectoria sarmentosa]|nr:MAG: hypothetical protein ASARMPRED_004019 [Alectoria sarmentosa]
MGSLTSLAEEILANAKRLDHHLSSQHLSATSFDHDSLADLPSELESTRKALIDSTQTLKQLSQGPVGSSMEIIFNWTDLLSLRVIYEFKLSQAVPIEGSTTYQDISSRSGLPEPLVRRFMRHAMGNHIFAEASPDSVRHTAASRMMVTDPGFFDAVGLEASELAPTAGRVIEALKRYGDSGEPNESAFSLANETAVSMYQFLGQHPERARRFGSGMRFFTKGESWDLKHLVSGFDWASVDRPGATVVDVGGNNGSVSQFLAQSTRHITFIVQDLPGTVEQGRASLPAEFQGRIEFMAHDFFTEQTLQSAPDIYLFRWIMHNWSDPYCVKMLQNLSPTMRHGSRILIYEYVLEDTPETRLTEKMGPNLDMIMAACFNSAERTRADWLRLLDKADGRFRLHNISRPEGSTMSVIEVLWKAV